MSISSRLIGSAVVAAALAVPSAVAAQAGDRDEQIVITGCVMGSGPNDRMGPRSLLVWSDGDVYLERADVQLQSSQPAETPVGTTGQPRAIFYWLDDEDDFARHVGMQVEIVGELSGDFEEGEFEVEHDDAVSEIEFSVDGDEVTARVPRAWLGPSAADDASFDIVVREVDVENVTALGPCNPAR